MGNPHRIGIVGLGWISGAYLETLAEATSVVITGVADLDPARATALADRLPNARALSVDELVAADEVDTVLNLTVPAAHAEIALTAIAHGKHVYGEKPLAVTMGEARSMRDAAARAGVRLGSAPDTVLGTGTQTARAVLDDGVIGAPLAAVATMMTPGHERWHHNPDFYYQPGGGPLLDMGPYYVASLIHMLGPIRSVVGSASRIRHEREIGSGPRAGERVSVHVDTHVSGILEHHSGALTTLTTSFDAIATRAAPIEVHGEAGSIAVPDPNTFDGDVQIAATPAEWTNIPPRAGYSRAARGVGLLDFIAALARGETGRANGDVALHSLEVMLGLLESARSGQRVVLETTTERPAMVPLQPMGTAFER